MYVRLTHMIKITHLLTYNKTATINKQGDITLHHIAIISMWCRVMLPFYFFAVLVV